MIQKLAALAWIVFLLAACQPIVAPAGGAAVDGAVVDGAAVDGVVAGAPGVGDPIFPLLGNAGYDVQHYTLDLTVDPPANVITGTAALRIAATQPLQAFNLDLLGLEVGGVTVDGAPARFARSGQELTITPTLPIAADAIFTTVVAYAGTPSPLADSDIDFIDQGERQVAFAKHASDHGQVVGRAWRHSLRVAHCRRDSINRSQGAKPTCEANHGKVRVRRVPT